MLVVLNSVTCKSNVSFTWSCSYSDFFLTLMAKLMSSNNTFTRDMVFNTSFLRFLSFVCWAQTFDTSTFTASQNLNSPLCTFVQKYGHGELHCFYLKTLWMSVSMHEKALSELYMSGRDIGWTSKLSSCVSRNSKCCNIAVGVLNSNSAIHCFLTRRNCDISYIL